MNEKRILNEEGDLKSFIDPFINVYRVAKTSAKGIANSTGAFLAILNPFLLSPHKIDRLLRNYDARARRIRSELSGLNSKVVSSLGPDTSVIAFLAAPAAFITLHASREFLSTSNDILLDATGIGPWVSEKLGLYWDKFRNSYSASERKFRQETGTSTPLERAKESKRQLLATQGPLGDLMRIFFFAHHERSGNSLNESKNSGKKDFYYRLSDEMKSLGLNDKTQILFNEFKKAKDEQINEFLKLAENYEKISELIINSNDFNSFFRSLDQFPEIKKSVNELLQKNKQDFGSMYKFLKQNFKPNDSLLKKTVKSILSDVPPIDELKKMPKNENVKFLISIYQRLQKYL